MQEQQLLVSSAFTPILPEYMDATQMTCFRSCPQKFFIEFVLGLRPPGLSIDLHAGGCVAAAIEETYRGLYEKQLTLREALEYAHARFLIEWGNFEIPHFKRTSKTMDRTWEAIVGDGTEAGRGYFEMYPPETDDIKPFITAEGKPTIEYTFAVPLEPCASGFTSDGRRYSSYDPDAHRDAFPLHPSGRPFLWSGRFDMLGQLASGKAIPKDDKTTGRSPSEEWSRQWQLRTQFMGYVWALQQCGLDVDSVAVRGIGILKESIRHAEHIQPFSDFLIARWYEQLRRDMWRLRRAWDEQYWDFNFGEACTNYGNCIFMDSCNSRNGVQWLSDFQVRRWNPLLKNPVAVADPSLESANA